MGSDLTQFGYFERPVVRDMIHFTSRMIVKRTAMGQRQTVEHQEYLCHAFNKEGLAAITFADKTYPRRSAFCVINKVLDDYLEKFGQNWRNHSRTPTRGTPSWKRRSGSIRTLPRRTTCSASRRSSTRPKS